MKYGLTARSKLACYLKPLMTELSTDYGPSCVSYDAVRRWKNKFESGEESTKMHQNQVGKNLRLVKKSFQK